MSRYVASTVTLRAVVLLVAVMTVTSGYPYVRQRKADPFAALATTLRQQQEVNPNYGYEEDYAGNVRPVSAEDDLWRLEQLQRQLGRAAVMPFYGVRPQRSWMNLDGEEPEGHVIRESPPVVEYGVPIDEVVDQGSVWYDDAPSGPLQVQTADDFVGGYGPSSSSSSLSSQSQLLSEQERQKQAENELLLNTLAEYMLLYDSEKAAALPVGDKRTGSHQEGEQNSTPTSSPASAPTTTTSAATTTSATTSSSAASSTTSGYKTPGQPPVQIGEDGTPMGQKEFPMMRPANTQRKQWLATQGKLDFTSKRHRFQKSQSEIITPEDRLTRELDSLKTKKN